MATPGPMNPDAVCTQAKRLINTQLKAVLKSCNLPVSGAKAAMQQRIINRKYRSHLTFAVRPSSISKSYTHTNTTTCANQVTSIKEVQHLAQTNNVDGFNRIRDRIYHPEPNAPGQSPSPQAVRTFQNDSRPQQSPYGQPFSAGQGRPMMPSTIGTTLSMIYT